MADDYSELGPFLGAAGGYVPVDADLFEVALTHASCGSLGGIDVSEHNERLEFMGDSIWGLVVTEYIMREDITAGEGQMTLRRTQYISNSFMARCADHLRIKHALRHVGSIQGR